MRLSALLEVLPAPLAPRHISSPESAEDTVIRGIAYDSRQVAPGDLFFALRGVEADGHRFLGQALELGAAAVCVEALPEELETRGQALVVLPDTRRALAPVAAAFYGRPCEELSMLGVTGTNGKTSTTYLCESILAAAGRNVGLIGTVEIRFGGTRQRALNTTPESLDLQRTLREMHTLGVDTCVMEVSSHGLDLGRVEDCHFDVACFTNLTQDHLDFHGDMANYQLSKQRLFERHLKRDACAVVNIDDPAGEAFLRSASDSGARTLRVSRNDPAADVFLSEADVGREGSRARLRIFGEEIDVHLPLIGAFNLENLLVACGAAAALEVPAPAIAEGVAACPQVPGRVERVGAEIEGAPTVLVDYAHTPDAVEKVLAALSPLCRGRLVAVFGCGGDRDRTKRPLMAAAVARHADRIVATSDNPRTEDPEQILDDVVEGLSGLSPLAPEALDQATGGYARISDRREAIERAIGIARAEDTVLIAGKGHEDYQIIGRERLPFDDREEARRALRARGPRGAA